MSNSKVRRYFIEKKKKKIVKIEIRTYKDTHHSRLSRKSSKIEINPYWYKQEEC